MGLQALGALQLAGLAAVQGALALVLGSWASSRWLRGAEGPWSARCRRWTSAAGRTGAVLGFAALASSVWLQAAAMAEVPLPQAGAALVTLLRDTHYGHAALMGFVAWCAVAAAAWRGARGRAIVLGLLVVAWSRSAVSHAADSGDCSFEVAVDVVHLLATSLWAGMVFVAVRWPRPGAAMSDRVEALRWVSSLSAYATGALAAVVLTGLFKLYRAVPHAALLPGSDYGRALFFKLGLAGAAALLGGYNRFRVLPALQDTLGARGSEPVDGRWSARLLAVLRVEAAMLLLVLGWAAVLSSTEPVG